jgi:hypothetical protein
MSMPASHISEDYRKMQQKLHENPNYGVASVQFAPTVAKILQQFKINELLDYGAGKGRLGQTLRQTMPLPVTIHHYDPAIPEWSAEPKPCGFVCSIDVLEHIEPELLDNVLDHLRELVLGAGFFTVHIGPAIKVLPDGRNAHLIQQPPSWWLPKFMERFELLQFSRVTNGFWVLVQRKPEGSVEIAPV